MRRTVRNLDHRDQPVWLASPERLAAGGVDVRSLVLPGVGLKAGKRPWNPRLHWTLFVWLAVYLVVGSLIAVAAMRAGLPRWTFGLFLGVGLLAAWVTPVRRWWRNAVGPTLVDRVLASGHCPGCGYALDGIDPGDDGITTCAECGAAWRR